MEILCPISVAELFDKLSILEIKLNKIKNVEKSKIVEKEMEKIKTILKKYSLDNYTKADFYVKLSEINKKIWEIGLESRKLEKNKDFNSTYIKNSIDEHRFNEERSNIKRFINEKFKSDICEAKEYREENY